MNSYNGGKPRFILACSTSFRDCRRSNQVLIVRIVTGWNRKMILETVLSNQSIMAIAMALDYLFEPFRFI